MRPGDAPIRNLARALDAPGRPRRRRRTRDHEQRAHRGDAAAQRRRARGGGAAGPRSQRRERPGPRRPVRGAVPLPPQPPDPGFTRRGDRVRPASPRCLRPAAGADLRRHHHEVGLHRRLHGLPRASRSGQCGAVSRRPDDARWHARGDYRAGGGGRRIGRRRGSSTAS